MRSLWICTICFLFAIRAHADFSAVVVGVHDGDTCKVKMADNLFISIRLAGIDAPELKQAGGKESRDALAAKILGQRITVSRESTDRYGRTVGVVTFDGKDVCLEQVRAGHAWVYSAYVFKDLRNPYNAAQAEAQETRRGLWSANRVVAPWLYRQRARDATE